LISLSPLFSFCMSNLTLGMILKQILLSMEASDA
jgi:hypothetical protein